MADGIHQLVARLDISTETITFFIHGATVAANTLLERKAAQRTYHAMFTFLIWV